MILKKPDFLKSPLEHYRSHLEVIFQDKSSVFREKSVKKKLPFVYTIVFPKTEGRPLLSFSYGLSFAPHPDQHNKIELFLQMNSEDMAWAHIVGYLSNQLRGECPFNTGEIIRIGQKISSESSLNAFVVINPDSTILQERIKDGRKSNGIQLVELLPIYEEEVLTIQRLGLAEFINRLKPNKLNPLREKI
ncbi:suppressor of fused domain protein [Sphingobacterium daejeonense]|uniref:Suppressor of fused domain protein n=1 Tax=Sphingobacterium daejeonense TaxID=371142 RepID=A0ABW3RN07_9SPHI